MNLDGEERGAGARLQRLMEEQIPPAKAAGFRILEANRDGVRIRGTIALNHNHHDTVFGGSISMVMILAGWAMAEQLAEELCPGGSIVIERHTTDFLTPVEDDFIAHCSAPVEAVCDEVRQQLAERGRARIELSASLYEEARDREAARFTGIYYLKG